MCKRTLEYLHLRQAQRLYLHYRRNFTDNLSFLNDMMNYYLKRYLITTSMNRMCQNMRQSELELYHG